MMEIRIAVVNHFHLARRQRADKDVLWFQIAMDYIVRCGREAKKWRIGIREIKGFKGNGCRQKTGQRHYTMVMAEEATM